MTISDFLLSHTGPKEIADLLAEARVVRSACDLDLLVFLYRHPRALLSSEQLTAFVGHALNNVAESLERFIAAGILERTQNPTHAARMYLLALNGPEGDSARALIELASGRQGRQEVLKALYSAPVPRATLESGERLLRIA